MLLEPAEPALADALPWLGVVSVLLLAAVAAAAWVIAARLKQAEARLSRLEKLDPILAALERVVKSEDGLDLRRLEHVLIDIRDGQNRVENRLLAVVESGRGTGGSPRGAGTGSGGALPVSGASALAERVVNRLLALGYERVQLVTPIAEIAKLVDGDGEIQVEARRDGAPCKGRISVRAGALADLQIQSAYSAFP